MFEDDGSKTIGRDGKPVPRLNVPTPCSTCPRKSPDNEAATTLTPKNIRAFEFALENRATGGALVLGQVVAGRKIPPITLAVLSTVDQVLRQHETDKIASACSLGTLTAMSSMLGGGKK